MNMSTDEMLQSYGLDAPFPQQWNDTKHSSALATLGNGATTTEDSNGALVDELLSSLTTTHAVAADEQDPLGSGMSIMAILGQRTRGLPESAAERGTLLPSSPSFDPRRFLREVHGSSSIAVLERGLAQLRESMAGNEHGLRQMVDTDYESFVSSKRRLDEVMGQLEQIGVNTDTEFGMKNLDARLEEAINLLAVRSRPLDGVATERQRLESALQGLEAHRKVLELPQSLKRHLAVNDHDNFVREYKRGTRLLAAMASDSSTVDEQRLGALVANQAQLILHKYRDQMHQRLMKTTADGAYAPILAKLADLGVSGNPAVEWLEHNISRFAEEMNDTFNLLLTNTTRNYAESVESEKMLDVTTYLHRLPADPDSIDEVADQLDSADFAADSESVVQQWTQLLASFESLRHTLGRATVFYHEFISLSKGSASSSGSLRLTRNEITQITAHCQKLLQTAGERLVECMTAPVNKSLSLPIAAAHDSDARKADGFPGGVTLLPLHTNSLAAAKYLSRILEILSLMVTQVSELAPLNSTHDLAQSVAVVKQYFVKALCDCWVRDSMKLGQLQDWNDGNVPDYFAAFHELIIEKLRFLLDANRGGPSAPELVTHITTVFPTALSLSVQSIGNNIVGSARTRSVDGQSAAIEAQLQPASLSQDSKFLVTLNNLEVIKTMSLEQVYDQFESVFRQQQQSRIARSMVTPEIDNISAHLFDVYIRKKRSKLSKVVDQETQRLLPAWQDDPAKPPKGGKDVRRVSNYVYECLMILVETHASFTESCPPMTRRAILELYSYLLSCILKVLRDVDSLSRLGSLQNLADLEFMRWAMVKFPETAALCQQIFETIQRTTTSSDIWAGAGGFRGLINDVLTDSIKQSQLAFLCFKSFP